MTEKKLVLKATRRLSIGGNAYMNNDTVPNDLPEEILTLYMAKDWILPVGGWDALPEELFLGVMEARDCA